MLRFPTVLILSILSAVPAIAAEIPVDTDITGVTIYQDIARVTRESRVNVPAGNHTLVFSGLTSSLDQNSLTLGIPSRNLAIGALEVRAIQQTDVTAERERELRNQI